MQKGTLYGVVFDLAGLQVRGAPVPLVTGVGTNTLLEGGGQYTVSNTGTFAYLPSGQVNNRQPLMWMTSSGQMTPLVAQPGQYGAPRFSPDGAWLASIATGPKGGDVWVHHLQRDTSNQLTFTAPGIWEIAWRPIRNTSRTPTGGRSGGCAPTAPVNRNAFSTSARSRMCVPFLFAPTDT
ncbi:MAG: hypothetical protein ACRD3G_04455 [Vicinamibacterales bacterium]